MTAAHFFAIVSAETRKLFSRSSARFGLAFAVFVGLGVPLGRGILRLIEMRIGSSLAASDPSAGAPSYAPIDPAYVVYATLWLRNFFFMRIILIMMGALTMAGEFQARTLREDVLRPVPRSAVFAAKWLALVAWIGATLLLTYSSASLLSLVAWGTSGSWLETTEGFVATLVCDSAFAVLVLMTAIALRSVAGTMVAMFLFYFVNVAIGFGLLLVANLPISAIPEWGRDAATKAGPWLPSSAYDAWTGANPYADWSWQGFVSLGILFVVSWAIADRVFARVDVP